MKRDIEHVVASTAMLVIAVLLSPAPAPAAARTGRGPNIAWSLGVAVVLGALAWTANLFVTDMALCARLRLHVPEAFKGARPPLVSPEIVDLTALAIEAVLLVALAAIAIRRVHRRRLARADAPTPE